MTVQTIIANVFETQSKSAIRLRSEPISNRKARLIKVENWVIANRLDIQQALAADLKKPKQEADLTEIFPVLSEIRKAKRNLQKWTSPQKYPSSFTFFGTSANVYHEPKGVCLIISPWNYPFMLTLGPVISAIAAGNVIFIKPSEFTPATSSLIKRMSETLFETDIMFTLEGDSSASKLLLELPFNHIFFTGSPQVGQIIMSAASKYLASVTLELGGKSPTIVDETANIKISALKIAWGKWINAGQTCVAPDYIFVHNKVKDTFLSELVRQSKALYALKENYTCIVNEKHFRRLLTLKTDLGLTTEQLYLDGEVDDKQLSIGPTIFVNVPLDSSIMKEEIFGPILPVLSYDNLDEVVDYINSKEKPLALYLFSKSRKNQQRILKETSSGTAVLNDCVLQFAHSSMPFGGVNNSGFGKSHGIHGFKSFSNEKSVLKQRNGFTVSQMLYPPYTPLKNKVIELLLKYF
ncbi:MAG: aldehyde dehydrogenase (NAD+) [Cyclobacteriaceae bacterium]|jgi:aldehyde dehydrogenase (NAD+)